MSPGNLLELAIIAFIIISISVVAWRGGAKNPVSTGSVDKKLDEIKSSIDSELSGVKAKVGVIEQRLDKFEEAVASVADIRRLEKAVERLAKVQADHESRQRALSDKQSEHAAISAKTAAAVDHIDRNVNLMMSVVVPKGMEK